MKKLWDKVWTTLPYVWSILLVLVATSFMVALGSAFVWLIISIWGWIV
jgi:hypothetical protein